MNNNLQIDTKLIKSALALAVFSGIASADPMPQEESLSSIEISLIGRDDLYSHQSLNRYAEAPFLTDLVSAGQIPPIGERLPKQPVVFKTDAMVDGVGEYGGVFRHVIGGRPQGWHFLAGQHQGWGGINMAVQECLIRQGPRWQVKAEEQTGPLPNLARSWEWNNDKTELTMHLVEGAKWSDGDPFDVEDIQFWWEDNVENPEVQGILSAGEFGTGTSLEVIDDYTFKFRFTAPQSESLLESLAYNQGCPGPSHVLKEHHPKYNSSKSYEDYRNALPADVVPIPVLGAWVPVLHRPDELVVLRRNPFYWKVDERGNQLPYINEMHFKLTTWDDRTTQAVAGTGDFSNMENPGNYVEALKQSQEPDAPVSVKFGSRNLVWRIELNFAAKLAEDPVDRQLRTLFRDKNFRLALSHALDRNAVGQAVARGPFFYPYTGGFASGSPYYDYGSTEYQPYNPDGARSLLAGLGLSDTDGNGILNLPGGGEDLTLDIIYKTERNEDRKMADAVTSLFADVGIRVLLKPVPEKNFGDIRNRGDFNVLLQRSNFVLPTYRTCEHLPISDSCPGFHLSGAGGRDLLPFETELASLNETIVSTDDPRVSTRAAQQMQKILTENLYVVGLVQAPAALLVNKRIRNVHPGTPVFMYDWAEDGIIRERLWIPREQQITELLPNTIAQY